MDLDFEISAQLTNESRRSIVSLIWPSVTYEDSLWNTYFDFYDQECKASISGLHKALALPFTTHREIVLTIQTIASSVDFRRSTLRDVLRKTTAFNCFVNQLDNDVLNRSIAFCLRLWLMVNIHDETDAHHIARTIEVSWDDDSVPLREFITQNLGPPTASILPSNSLSLPKDFCAENFKSLGIRISPTYSLKDHLVYYSEGRQLKIFPYPTFLRAHMSEQASPFDRAFLEETLETLKLLYPNKGIQDQLRGTNLRDIWAESDRHSVPLRSLGQYKIYWSHLAKLNSEFSVAAGGPNWFVGSRQIEFWGHEQELHPVTTTDGTFKFEIGEPPPVGVQHQRWWSSKFSLRWLGISQEYTRIESGSCPRGRVVVTRTHNDEHRRLPDSTNGYVVIGIFRRHHRSALPDEAIVTFPSGSVSEKDLFFAMRAEYHKLRGWRWWLSLKDVCKFGLYQCVGQSRRTDSTNAIPYDHYFHERLKDPTAQQEATMAELYTTYRSKSSWGSLEPSRNRAAWVVWIDKYLNLENDEDGRTNLYSQRCRRSHTEGGLSIEFIESWSSFRIAILAAIPAVSSLGIGFLYQYVYSDVQTAWTIASYIVTTFAVLTAVLAIISVLTD